MLQQALPATGSLQRRNIYPRPEISNTNDVTYTPRGSLPIHRSLPQAQKYLSANAEISTPGPCYLFLLVHLFDQMMWVPTTEAPPVRVSHLFRSLHCAAECLALNTDEVRCPVRMLEVIIHPVFIQKGTHSRPKLTHSGGYLLCAIWSISLVSMLDDDTWSERREVPKFIVDLPHFCRV